LQNVKLNKGEIKIDDFTIKNPKLWYPFNLGAQDMYSIEININIKND